jgi:hypothetical protein
LDTIVGVTDPNTAANKAATAHCLEKVSEVASLLRNPRGIYEQEILFQLNKQPDGPPAALRQMIYGYIQQVRALVGTLFFSKNEKGKSSKQLTNLNLNHLGNI